MSEQNPQSPHRTNDPKSSASPAARKLSCDEWEAMLVDHLDGTLPVSDGDSFHSHRQSCASCAEMFANASKGREWLNFLRTEPQVSPALVSKILAQTSGALDVARPIGDLASPSTLAVPATQVLPFWKRAPFAGAGHRVAQPRLLMTAAMAFFSITLTLNMAGVRLTAIHVADLSPTAMSSNLNRQYHMASARVVRYYDNLRFVYEMEARVRELRQNEDLDNPPVDKQDQPSAPTTPDHKSGGKSEGPSNPKPHAMLWGEQVEASLEPPLGESPTLPLISGEIARRPYENAVDNTEAPAADQAERGIA